MCELSTSTNFSIQDVRVAQKKTCAGTAKPASASSRFSSLVNIAEKFVMSSALATASTQRQKVATRVEICRKTRSVSKSVRRESEF